MTENGIFSPSPRYTNATKVCQAIVVAPNAASGIHRNRKGVDVARSIGSNARPTRMLPSARVTTIATIDREITSRSAFLLTFASMARSQLQPTSASNSRPNSRWPFK